MCLVLVMMLLAVITECQATKHQQPSVIVPLHSSNPPAAYELEIRNNTLQILPIASKTEFQVVIDFVSRAISGKHTRDVCSEVIGVVGDLDMKTARIIDTLASRANLSIALVSAVAPSTFMPTTNLNLPNLIHMNPLTHYVEALAAFLDHLNWTRIGLISDNIHYYEFAAELIQQKLLENPKRRIIPFMRITERDNRTKTIQTFKEYETDVIVISTTNKLACSLIQEAKNLGFLWPDYAWILYDVDPVTLETCREEGIILIKQGNSMEKPSASCVRCNYTEKYQFLSSSIFIDSIIAAFSAYSNSSFNATARFREGKVLNIISIFQLIGNSGSRRKLALYDAESQYLDVFESFTTASEKPRGTILRVRYSDQNVKLHTTFIALIYASLFTFVTLILILYLYFRREPEIRATSVTVSLFMFLGCYILISYLPIRVSAVETSSDFRCNLLVWLSLGGIPFTLITATMFAKMLRVYLIFSDPLSFKKTLFHDPFLFVYIVLLVFPSILILITWASSDPFRSLELNSTQENVILINRRCISVHTLGWLGALLGYIFILFSALACLAIKTSKIRYKHFRDTKATNAFVFLSSFVMFLTLVYWYFFYEQGIDTTNALVSDSVLYIGHSTIAVICQVLLFVPKVYPPIKRWLTRKRI